MRKNIAHISLKYPGSRERQFGNIQDKTIKPEDITYTIPPKKNYNNFSYKNIQITHHARQRASTRLGIDSEREIQKLAASAKKNGLNLGAITMMNYERFGLDFKQYKWLKDKVFFNSDSEQAYFYKGYFFVFTGQRRKTLKTIVIPGATNEDDEKEF